MWRLEFSKSAEKDFLKLDKAMQEEAMKFFKKIVNSENPKIFSSSLVLILPPLTKP